MDRIDPIPTALIPPPDVEQPPVDEHSKIFTDAIEAKERAQQLVTEYRQREHKLETALQDAIRGLKEAVRDSEFKDLRIAQLENNLAAAQSQGEAWRQEASDTRALFSTILGMLTHFEIPLPIRKRRNGARPQEANAA